MKALLLKVDRDQNGAVALLVLAAVLISFMLALVVFDTTTAARQKVDVQTAADAAAWSQSAVEARTMNMLAFSNVGKRIVMGMSVYYQTVSLAWAELFAIVTQATNLQALVCLVTIVGGCPNADMLQKTFRVQWEIALIGLNEILDTVLFYTSVLPKIKDDVDAFDAYQAYQIKLTPWHSWAEATIRGSRNGATSVGMFPVPENILENGRIGTGLTDRLPVEKASGNGEMCLRSTVNDLPIFVAEYLVKNLACSKCSKDVISPKGARRALHALAAGFAAFQYPLTCNVLSRLLGDAVRPYEMTRFENESDWLLASSNLAFTYRSGADLSGKHRGKYGFVSGEFEHAYDIEGLRSTLYESDGFFGVSRSEISFQGGAPDLWHASWSARMRPVALPGEWSGYGRDLELVSAYNDVVPYLAVGAKANEKLSTSNEQTDLRDFARGFIAFEAYRNENIQGLTR